MSIKERELPINNPQQSPDTIIQIVQDVEKNLALDYPHPWSNLDKKDKGIMDILRRLEEHNFFTPKIGQTVLKLRRSFGSLAAERLLENCEELFGKPRFDFDEYSQLVLAAYKRFGRRAGGYFSFSYGQMIDLGVKPQDSFGWTEKAVLDGGKYLGAWYAYCLPGIFEAGADPAEVADGIASLEKAGGFKTAKTFIMLAEEAAGADFAILDLARLSEEAIEKLGKKITPWTMRAMVALADLGYDPAVAISKAKQVLEQKGEKAAVWYISGLTACLNEKRDILGRINNLESRINDPKATEGLRVELRQKLEDEKVHSSSFYPFDFEKSYLELLEESGQNSATFYSLALVKWKRFLSGERLQKLSESLRNLQKQVSKKAFSQALWFVLKINPSPETALHLLKQIGSMYAILGEKETIKAIRYTWGVSRRTVGGAISLERPAWSLHAPIDYTAPTSEEEWLRLFLEAQED